MYPNDPAQIPNQAISIMPKVKNLSKVGKISKICEYFSTYSFPKNIETMKFNLEKNQSLND